GFPRRPAEYLHSKRCACIGSLGKFSVSRQPRQWNGKGGIVLHRRMRCGQGAEYDRAATAVSPGADVGLYCSTIVSGTLRNMKNDWQAFRDMARAAEALGSRNAIQL